MSLPLVLDIAIGLTFIYLILSLIASEIQELIATVLQWRAKHLKESIENLLVGDNKELPELEKARKLANQLYTNPLIENLNQEARGFLANLFRQPIRELGKKNRLINRQETVFGDGKRTGPSYLPSETFATTLLETLKIPASVHKFSKVELSKFQACLLEKVTEILVNYNIANVNKNTLSQQEIKRYIANSEDVGESAIFILEEFEHLTEKLDAIVEDFSNKKSTLSISIARIENRIETFITSLSDEKRFSQDFIDKFKNDVRAVKNNFFEEKEREILIEGMKPSLTEVTQLIADNDELPQSLKQSISALAHRVQSKVETLEKDISQLRQEIEIWFDRSMERTSGVYKRNAKGVALLIGFSIAIITNADTCYMVNKFSTDRDLRNAIAQNAQVINTTCANTPNELDCVRDKTKAALEDVPLSIGWNSNTLTDQWSLPFTPNINQQRIRQWDFLGWNADSIIKQLYPQYQTSLNFPKTKFDWFIWLLIHVLIPVILLCLLIYWGIRIIWNYQKLTTLTYISFIFISFLTACLVIFTGLKVILGVILGWSLSAIAISMGAPFWFDLLGKVINVRNTGSKPESLTNNQVVAHQEVTSVQTKAQVNR